jgi:hypothetical protein
MATQGTIAVLGRLVRILSTEDRFRSTDGSIDRAAIAQEAQRLLEEDSDFRELADKWPKERSFRFQWQIGAESESLEDFRAEIERWRTAKEHPLQQFRYEILASGSIATILWGLLSGALESEELERSSLAFQVVVVAIALGIGAFFAWGIATQSSREDFYKILKPDLSKRRLWAFLSLAGLLFVILLFATLGFAGVTELLYLHGIAETDPDHLEDPLVDSMTFYVWSLLDAIPVLQIPQTLRWELDYRFTDHVSPVLLLAYKLAVILPAIATARLAWQAHAVSRP